MKRLTDPDFAYVPACATNIRATFKRIRREQKAAAEARSAEQSQQEADTARVITIMETRRTAK
jgi:hypothetical protein